MDAVPAEPTAPLRFAAAYFGAVFVAGFGLGVVRTLWLAPAVGPLAAHWALYRTGEAQLGLAGQLVFGLLPALRAGRKSL